MFARCLAGSLVIAMSVGVPLVAQPRRPMAPQPPEGLRVAPFFDGFITNPDGTVTFVFGYSNPNRDEVLEIPIGPDNFVEPKQFDGRQPTSFPPIIPDTPDGGGAPATNRRERERGVFTVTVPAGFKGDVVWTLRNRGQVFSVPARTRSGAYGLRWPMAMGSTPPLLSFKKDGPTGRGPAGITAEPMKTSVATPLSITVYLNDDAKREKDETPVRERGKPRGVINVSWFKHSGPGPIEFSPAKDPIMQATGTSTTAATFKQPGEYVVRVKADVFGRLDTSAGNQCCWTNGYVKVTVTP